MSKSASAKIILGFLPPNSNETFLNIGAVTVAICFPVIVPPVKEIIGVSLCIVSGSPVFAPNPCTIFKTPLGKPASMHILLNKYAVIGVTSEGFATTVLPDAKAGAIFQVSK